MSAPELVSVEEAQAQAVATVKPLGAERVLLSASLGRVLARSITAHTLIPPDDNSAMDGFAVRAEDVRTVPVELQVVGEIAAGQVANRAIAAGETLRIMTGALIPTGADAVVMVEHTEMRGHRVRIVKSATSGQHIRKAGDDVRPGDEVLVGGITIGAAEIGVLASLQQASVTVSRHPVVAILSTGDELRDLDQPLTKGAIAESSSYTLAACVTQAGGIPRVLPLVRDDPTTLRQAIIDASPADLIVSTGGVSVGEHDHVKEVLAELGAKLHLWRVDMKPGKPVVLAQLGAVPYFGLPGNPVSTVVAFHLFVRPAIRTALGCRQPFDLPQARAALTSALKLRGDRRTYLFAQLAFSDQGRLRATPMARQGSHLITSMVGANGLIVIQPQAGEHAAGCDVDVLILPQ